MYPINIPGQFGSNLITVQKVRNIHIVPRIVIIVFQFGHDQVDGINKGLPGWGPESGSIKGLRFFIPLEFTADKEE